MRFPSLNKRVPGRIHFHNNNNNVQEAASNNGESLLSSEATAQLEEMRGAMFKMEQHINQQNQQMQQMMVQQCKQMNMILETLDPNKTTLNGDDEKDIPIESGNYSIEWGNTIWSITGVSSRSPDPDYEYFPGLRWTVAADPNHSKSPPSDKVISAIIPCYNEEGKDLERTIRGLSRQVMVQDWRIECVIVMDGANAISDSMAAYLQTLFGVDLGSQDPEKNPLVALPNARTIIVQAQNKDAAYTRQPVMEGAVGGYSLVVKRENRRKANSQQWWLGPHATAIGCKYALATDCGTYFERDTVIRLIERLDDDIAIHAVTGTQRTMPADLQGDGNFELCYHPFQFLLRQLQRFEFEVCLCCVGYAFVPRDKKYFVIYSPVLIAILLEQPCSLVLRWTM
jgi:hypothetical protein